MVESIKQTITKIGQQTDYKSFSKKLANDGLTNVKRNFNDSKVSDHYAIIPTGKLPKNNLSQDAAKLYDLIAVSYTHLTLPTKA